MLTMLKDMLISTLNFDSEVQLYNVRQNTVFRECMSIVAQVSTGIEIRFNPGVIICFYSTIRN